VKTVEYCICDGCNKPITDEFDGLIIHGGIYTADPKEMGGLVGNYFEPDTNGMVEYNKIAKTVLCMSCFDKTISKDRFVSTNYAADTLRKLDEWERWESQ
jgi:hypothetical protein